MLYFSVLFCAVLLLDFAFSLYTFQSSIVSISTLTREESGCGALNAFAIFVRGGGRAGAGEIVVVTQTFSTTTAQSYLLGHGAGLD